MTSIAGVIFFAYCCISSFRNSAISYVYSRELCHWHLSESTVCTINSKAAASLPKKGGGHFLLSFTRPNDKLPSLTPHLHGRKFWPRLGWKKYAYQKTWFSTDRFSRVNDFTPCVPDKNFTRARTLSRGSPSTDKIGTRSWKAPNSDKVCSVND